MEEVTYTGSDTASFLSEMLLTDISINPGNAFDWEAYTSQYPTQARIQRLTYIAKHCASLRIPCSRAAISLIQSSTRNVSDYQYMVTVHNTQPGPSSNLIPASDRISADSSWIQSTQARNNAERQKLELEMRNYQNNLIKESIRMAHRDLGDHFWDTGDYNEALKSYTKTRDYCSTTDHVIEMCLNVIEVSLRLENWSNVQTFVSKAEGVLEGYVPSGSGAGGRKLSSLGASGIAPPTKGANTAGGDAIGALFRAGGSAAVPTGPTSSSSNAQAGGSGESASQAAARKVVQETGAKLRAANAIACLGQGRYEAAAKLLLSIDPAHSASFEDMISQSDVSIYVAFCSLATMERNTLRTNVMENTKFRGVLEHEPHARELLEAFTSAQFKRVGEILDDHSARHLLDPYLAPHVHSLRTSLTRRALRQFFTPFDRISIARMAAAFGWKEGKMEEELVRCIERGEFKNLPGKAAETGDARIDTISGTMEYKTKDARRAVFDDALEMGDKRYRETKRLLLRMKLVENGVIAKANRAYTVDA
ncbi:related to COP9 signalosome complex subunit 1 [Melanopsichium pennsylvanicum]|uniref:Related to COP9 signalosome complex subunit 1 n=2 Tax=Melanopsichium pennsylvanicum TaxID=63383 RepID=A0AAJ5C7M9_9BASI|nr:related to COP9 signalosome complex subunit 1 [Melanopsichium pennsylvanicum 4]SNX87091.1 related to COP9 signalosome complex subunit 1 [Melanopsichium pennsylvanicum]